MRLYVQSVRQFRIPVISGAVLHHSFFVSVQNTCYQTVKWGLIRKDTPLSYASNTTLSHVLRVSPNAHSDNPNQSILELPAHSRALKTVNLTRRGIYQIHDAVMLGCTNTRTAARMAYMAYGTLAAPLLSTNDALTLIVLEEL